MYFCFQPLADASHIVIPKQGTVFNFGVPLYSVLSPTNVPASASVSTILAEGSSAERQQTIDDIPHILFTLYGNQFRFRASERAGRKFKAKESIEL
jgi:ribonuclease P protein subunit POP4